MTNNRSKKRGRPSLPGEEKRTLIVQFRCSEEEKAELNEAAEKEGCRLSDWLRDTVFRAARRRK